jgi:hypothetical protein
MIIVCFTRHTANDYDDDDEGEREREKMRHKKDKKRKAIEIMSFGPTQSVEFLVYMLGQAMSV